MEIIAVMWKRDNERMKFDEKMMIGRWVLVHYRNKKPLVFPDVRIFFQILNTREYQGF